MSSPTTYEAAVTSLRRGLRPGDAEIDYRELIRLGSLAASSHNAQPWTFSHDDGLIRIEPDLSRRCPVVDPDDAHLFKSRSPSRSIPIATRSWASCSVGAFGIEIRDRLCCRSTANRAIELTAG